MGGRTQAFGAYFKSGQRMLPATERAKSGKKSAETNPQKGTERTENASANGAAGKANGKERSEKG